VSSSDQQDRSALLDLKLAADLVEELEAALDDEAVGDLVDTAKTKWLSMPSVSETASQMKSMLRLNKLSKATDRRVEEVVARCDAIARRYPDVALEDGTDTNELKARAIYAKARLLMSVIPAMNTFKRKKSYREAIDILGRSLQACPNQAAHLAIGFCLSQLKDRQGAAAAFQRCIDLNDESEYALEAARRQRDLGLR